MPPVCDVLLLYAIDAEHVALHREAVAQRTRAPIVGGDMEGVGLLAASHPEDPLWCVVKGISDFAEADRSARMEQYRAPACEHAARFVLSALLHHPPRTTP